ncbi:MAG: competence protein ComEC family protein [Candidatus Omnitrophica bacterium]|jgi:competence protein ComEC|nr:competence protein ComEC family protein [Candidatus Omnitrophota bacterium]
MKHLFVFLVLGFCLGIIIAQRVYLNYWLVLGTCFLVFCVSFIAAKKSFWILITLFFCIGLLTAKNNYTLPKCHILKVIPRQYAKDCQAQGIVVSEPDFSNGRTNFILKTVQVSGGRTKSTCCGNVLVYIRGEFPVDYGQELVLRGAIYSPRYNYSRYLKNQGIQRVLSVTEKAWIPVLPGNKGGWLTNMSLRLKKKIRGFLKSSLLPVTSAIMGAMLIGDKKDIPPVLYQEMVRCGTVHILVVSGFNVGLVCMVLVLGLKILHVPKLARFFLAIFALIVYCILSGMANPVLRATIMALVFMCAYFLKREHPEYNSLALAVLFILIFNPQQLFDIGFQLSFVSVLAIVFLYPRLKKIFCAYINGPNFLFFVVNLFLVSFSAWLGTLGLVAYYFRIFSPVTVVANIVIVPLATIMTFCGFAHLFLGAAYLPLSHFSSAVCNFSVMLLIRSTHFFSSIPMASFSF